MAELQTSGKIQSNRSSAESKQTDIENVGDESDYTDEANEEPSLEEIFSQKLDALRERMTFWNRKLDEYVP